MRNETLGLIMFLAAAGSVSAASDTVRVVVAQDGSGDFKTIQMAIDHAPDYAAPQRLVIAIKPGTYHERIKVPQDRPRVTFLGTDAKTTILTFGMGAKEAGGTFFSSSVEVDGAAFEARNLTFENSYGTGTQAVAIALHSDQAVFEDCRFLAWQDTLYAASGRQYYRDCYIEGHVDFIFGNAAAVFEDCEIHSKGAGFIGAVSRTQPDQSTGFVFLNCHLTGENTGTGVFLGRPWRPYARVVYIKCDMDAHIRPEGWDNWNKNAANENIAWFGEFECTGPGAAQEKRVGWAHKLTMEEAAKFYPKVFLQGGDHWDPTSTRF